MFWSVSLILLYAGFAAAFSAWGQLWGTLVLVLYLVFNIVEEYCSRNRALYKNVGINILQTTLFASVTLLGSGAIGVTVWRIVDLELGILSFVITILIHVVYALGPE